MLELYLVLCKYKLRNSFFPVTNAVWQETIICSVSNVTFGVHLACRNFILCNKEPSWYSANQWESSLKKMKKHLICTHPSSTGLSYGDRISFGLSCFYTEVQRKWVCFLSCILIYSRTLRSIIASPKCKMELGRKTEQFKKKKNLSFMISSASLPLQKMQLRVTRELSAQQSLQTSTSTEHKRQQNAWFKWRAS